MAEALWRGGFGGAQGSLSPTEGFAAADRPHLETALEPDALLVTDGAPVFPPCARVPGP